MANKKNKKIDRRMFKKEGEELQQWLAFRKRGSRVESGKAYNRQKMKRGDREWKQHGKSSKSGKSKWMTLASTVPTAAVVPKWNWCIWTPRAIARTRRTITSAGAGVGSPHASHSFKPRYWKSKRLSSKAFFHFIFSVARPRPRRAIFLLYHIPSNLSRENYEKNK